MLTDLNLGSCFMLEVTKFGVTWALPSVVKSGLMEADFLSANSSRFALNILIAVLKYMNGNFCWMVLVWCLHDRNFWFGDHVLPLSVRVGLSLPVWNHWQLLSSAIPCCYSLVLWISIWAAIVPIYHIGFFYPFINKCSISVCLILRLYFLIGSNCPCSLD